MLSNNHPPSSNHVLNQNHDGFSCRQILPRRTTEKRSQVSRWPPGMGGQHCHPHPPLRGPGNPWWAWGKQISIQPLQYLPSIFIANTASLANNLKPGFDNEPGLRLAVAPAIKHRKYRSPSHLTATPELRKAQIKPGQKSHPALFLINFVRCSCSKSQGHPARQLCGSLGCSSPKPPWGAQPWKHHLAGSLWMV